MNIPRRSFLRLIAGGALTTGVPWTLDAAQATGIIRRPIPSTGEWLPVVGLGTARTFDVGSEAEARVPLREVLKRFFALGGRLLDTSPMYGNAEAVVGDLAEELGLVDQLFFATKVWTRGREAGVAQMQRSAERLNRRVVDLMQVHNLLDWETHLATLKGWKAAGRIRYMGITHYRTDAYDALERVMLAEPLDFVQLNYSVVTREAERRLLPLARERGIAVLVNRPFEQGALFRRVRGRKLPAWAEAMDCASWAQCFLKYVLGDAAVTCVIPATGDPRHLADNMGAGQGRLPDAGERRRLAAFIEEL